MKLTSRIHFGFPSGNFFVLAASPFALIRNEWWSQPGLAAHDILVAQILRALDSLVQVGRWLFLTFSPRINLIGYWKACLFLASIIPESLRKTSPTFLDKFLVAVVIEWVLLYGSGEVVARPVGIPDLRVLKLFYELTKLHHARYAMNKAQSRHQFQEITSSQVCGRCTVVASSAPVTDADRAALADLFK